MYSYDAIGSFERSGYACQVSTQELIWEAAIAGGASLQLNKVLVAWESQSVNRVHPPPLHFQTHPLELNGTECFYSKPLGKCGLPGSPDRHVV